MVSLPPELIRTLVQHFSHGAGTEYDPATQMGCQRESFRNLGFGWMYWALARILNPRKVLVIGSGRGFSVACLGLGIEDIPDAEVLFVDPGYKTWAVDNTQDTAAGLWQTAEQTVAHFADRLGLGNIQFLQLTSDEAFHRFRNNGDLFDLIFIDGEHSYQQALTDLQSAAECLDRHGIILAHDACCAHWPGVALALAALSLEAPWLESLSLPCYPGLSLIKYREPLVQVRPVTPRENEQVNAWRAAAGVHTRPLPHGDDPRPGIPGKEPREGLFGVFEGGQLIGGFGVRRRVFNDVGPDNFRPDSGRSLEGPLCYGVVLRPESRGQRRWQLVTCELLHWFREEGVYAITQFPQCGRDAPFVIERVGAAPPYAAFHSRLRKPSVDHADSTGLAEHSWRFAENQVFPQELARQYQDLAELQAQFTQASHELAARRQEALALQTELLRVSRERDALFRSTSWRWTYAARLLGQWARGFEKELGRHGRRLVGRKPQC